MNRLLTLIVLCLAVFSPFFDTVEAVCGPNSANVQDYVPINETEYDRTYATIGSGSHPLGFYSATWYYNQGKPNPCIRITAPNDQTRRLEIKVEPVPPSTRLCAKDQSSDKQCFQDTWTDCWETPGRVTYVEFLCDSGCQEGDVSFWYRLVLSPPSTDMDLDDWCFGRPSEFPLDLGVPPDGMTLPTITTRNPKDTGTASTRMPSFFLIAGVFMLVWYL